MAVAHLALDLSLGNERGDGVDDDDVDRAGADQRLGDLERVLTGIGLGNEQGIYVNTERGGIDGVKRVLYIDEGDVAAVLLTLRDTVQGEGGLTGGFRSEDLDDSAARQTADAQRDIQAQRTGRDMLDIHMCVLTELHDSALAELLFDL